jgi:glutathione S-transferase
MIRGFHLFTLVFLAPLAVFGLAVAGLAVAAVPNKAVLWNSGTCPYAQRAWIALVEKGIPFDTQTVDLKNKGPAFESLYRRANPNPLMSSKVPVLVVDDTHVYTESSVVCEAIEELWPDAPALLPLDLQARARVRAFSSVVYDSVFDGDRSAYKMAMRKLDSPATWDEQEERRRLCESLAALDTSLTGPGPFLLGSQFSLAECMTAPFCQRADAVLSHFCGVTIVDVCREHGYDRAGAWWKAVLERESVVTTGVSPEEAVDGAKRVFDIMRSMPK